MGLYFCASCSLPPLRFQNKIGYCYRHAVAAGLMAQEKEYDEPTRALDANAPVVRSTKKETLSEKMARLKRELQADGDWVDDVSLIVGEAEDEIFFDLNEKRMDTPF